MPKLSTYGKGKEMIMHGRGVFLAFVLSLVSLGMAADDFVPTAPDFTKKGDFERIRVTTTQTLTGYAFKYWIGENYGREEIAILVGIDTPEHFPNEKAHREAERAGVDLSTSLDFGYVAMRFLSACTIVGTVLDIEIVKENGPVKFVYAYVVESDISDLPGKCLNELMIDEGMALAPRGGIYAHPRAFQYFQREANAKKNKTLFWGSIWRNLRRGPNKR